MSHVEDVSDSAFVMHRACKVVATRGVYAATGYVATQIQPMAML